MKQKKKRNYFLPKNEMTHTQVAYNLQMDKIQKFALKWIIQISGMHFLIHAKQQMVIN